MQICTMGHEKHIPVSSDEVKVVNDNFTQMYNDHMHLIRRIVRENPKAAEMLFWLIEKMDERNALVVSQQAISEALQCHRNTIGNHTKYLTEIKAIDTLKTGTTSVYLINKEIAWKSTPSNKIYAQFGATVYVSESEQDQVIEHSTRLYGHAVERKRPGRPRKEDVSVAAASIISCLSVAVYSISQIL